MMCLKWLRTFGVGTGRRGLTFKLRDLKVSEHPLELESGTASYWSPGMWKMNRAKLIIDSGNRWRLNLMQDCCGAEVEGRVIAALGSDCSCIHSAPSCTGICKQRGNSGLPSTCFFFFFSAWHSVARLFWDAGEPSNLTYSRALKSDFTPFSTRWGEACFNVKTSFSEY